MDDEQPQGHPDRRTGRERRQTIDLTWLEAGHPERRRVIGVERRSVEDGEQDADVHDTDGED